jgi:4-amino-4-deoxy-L-arabinose transferase-like glycosyltransferase
MRSEPLGAQSSHWTIAAADQAFLIGVGLLTLFHFVLSAYLPPAEDELYYWTWAQSLQGSYFDHPPLVAYLIRLSTTIFGNSLFGIRFFSCLGGFFILLALRHLTRRTQVLTYLLFTPMVLVGSVLMTPDTPLLFFWACYLLWVTGINRPLNQWSDDPVSRAYHKSPIPAAYWALGGALLGLGFLGKYSMALAVPCSFLALATKHRARGWLGGYVLHLVVAALVATPVIYFNVTHHFVSFQFQWNNAMSGAGGFSTGRLFEFLGSQVLLLGALPLLMFPWVLVNRAELGDDNDLHVCYYFFVFPFIFFLFQSLRTKLEANWALVCYLAFWPMAQRLLDRSSFRTLGKGFVFVSFLVPLIVSAGLLVHIVIPIKAVPPKKDRLTRMHSEFALSKEIAADLKAHPLPAYFPSYQWTSYLRYQGIAAEQLYPPGRASQFTLSMKPPCLENQIVYFADTPEAKSAENTLSCFPKKELLKTYPLVVRGLTVDTYYLIRYSK